jgi:hypothetical protein
MPANASILFIDAETVPNANALTADNARVPTEIMVIILILRADFICLS